MEAMKKFWAKNIYIYMMKADIKSVTFQRSGDICYTLIPRTLHSGVIGKVLWDGNLRQTN